GGLGLGLPTGLGLFLLLLLLLGHDLGLGRRGLDDLAGLVLRDAQLVHEHLGADFLDVEDADHAKGGELVDLLLGDAGLLEGLRHDLQALGELLRREDVDVPPREAGRQADVLAALADRQRELVLADDDGGPPEFEAERDLGDLGRLEGVLDENLGRLVPADDVDLLAVEFVHDVLDAAAADADARADRVHLRVDRGDGDLGAVPGLAGHGLDLDDALGDLGDLDLEEALDEV